MANQEQAEGEEILGGNERGIYTLTSSDLKTIGDLEIMRNAYLMQLDGMSSHQRMDQLKSLLSDMQILMESYSFEKYLRETQVNGYTFYYVKESVDETGGDMEFIRIGSEIAFTIWKGVLKILGVAIPTYRSSVKKKIIDCLFNLVSNEIDEDKLIAEFESTKGYHSKFDFFWYCVSRMHDYDLDFNLVWVGKARSSKSTGALDAAEKFYGYRGVDMYDGNPPFYKKWIQSRVLYDYDAGMKAIRTSKADFNLFDETRKTHDRRKSMNKKQVELTTDFDFCASNNSVNVMLIQNFSDMDLRGTTKAGAVIINTGRGEGLLFSDGRFIALAKDQFGFEELINNPNVLKFPPLAIHMLKRQSSYICEFSWDKRELNDPFYAYYKKFKDDHLPKNVQVMTAKSIFRTGTKAEKIRELYRQGVKQIDVARRYGVSTSYVNGVVKGRI